MSTLQRFRDEARILGLIRDRAIVGVQPPTRLGGRWAVVMEFVEGVSARALLSRTLFPPMVALELVQEVCRALHTVWLQEGPDGTPLKLIHRDLKPGNLQVTPTGEVKILDFGIARAEFESREATTTQHIGGTLGYIAPERLQGEEIAAGDVYSMGVVLHQLITGELPKRATKGLIVPEGLGIGATEALELSLAMRQPGPEDRPTARDVERRCREIRARFTDAPYLRDWAEEWVPKLESLPSDEVVGQLLTESRSIGADSGLFVLDENQELMGLPPATPVFASARSEAPPATNPTLSLPLDEPPSGVLPKDTTEEAFEQRVAIPPPPPPRSRALVPLIGVVLSLVVAVGAGVALSQLGASEPVEPALGPDIRSDVTVAAGEKPAAEPEVAEDPDEATPEPVTPTATAPEPVEATEPVELDPAEVPEEPPPEEGDGTEDAVVDAAVVDEGGEETPEPAEVEVTPEEGAVEDEAQTDAEEASTPEPEEQVPDLRGTWSGKSSGRDVRVLLERQSGRQLTGRVEIVLGSTVRATPVTGTYDPDSGTVRLDEGGGGLSLSLSVAGRTLSGSMQARDGARPQRLDATRQ